MSKIPPFGPRGLGYVTYVPTYSFFKYLRYYICKVHSVRYFIIWIEKNEHFFLDLFTTTTKT